MSFISTIKGWFFPLSLQNTSAEIPRLRNSEDAEAPLSTSEALTIPATFRCVDILAGTIASLPIRLYIDNGNGYMIQTEDAPLSLVLSTSPQKGTTIYRFIERAVTEMLLHGNSYAKIVRTKGEVTALEYLPPQAVTYDPATDRYRVPTARGNFSTLQSADILHFRGKELDNSGVGVSVLQYATRTLNIAKQSDTQSLSTLQRGNRIKGIVSGTPATAGIGGATEKKRNDIAEQLNTQLQEGRDIISLPGQLTFQQIALSPADAQLLENRQYTVLDICRFFGVHPSKVFASGGTGNYKEAENQQTNYLTDTLQPLLRKIEAELKMKLIPRACWVMYDIAFDLTHLYKADPARRAEYYKGMLEIGALTTNEVRKRERLHPVQGGSATLVTCNVMPLQTLLNGEAKTTPSDTRPKE